jgi:O-antigen ligase
LGQERLYSTEAERSAVSRLAVYYASYQMFQDKPLFGWGYNNFNLYDRQYQWRFPGYPANAKDQSSHNLYLTILAEQGISGLLLFVFPLFWWLSLSIKRYRRVPKRGFWSQKFLIMLWLVLLSHIVVNNFSNMQVVMGLGMWWLVLGLVANLIHPNYLTGSSGGPAAYIPPVQATPAFKRLMRDG